MTIRARMPETKAEDASIHWVHQELCGGEYDRSITLSSRLRGDNAKAVSSDGILTLHIPKAEAPRPRQIKVNSNRG